MTEHTLAGYTTIVLAKAPVPGRVKTRLCPPCTPDEAAAISTGALADTLAALGQVGAARHLLVLAGEPGAWLPAGWEVVPQCDGGLDRRLGAAFAAADGPAVLVGMDTPQLRADVVEAAGRAVVDHPGQAVLGLANDGGFWLVALPRGGPEHFEGLPMSEDDTGEHQRRRLIECGLLVRDVEVLVDVDSWDEAQAVAAMAPAGHFAAEVAAVARRLS